LLLAAAAVPNGHEMFFDNLKNKLRLLSVEHSSFSFTAPPKLTRLLKLIHVEGKFIIIDYFAKSGLSMLYNSSKAILNSTWRRRKIPFDNEHQYDSIGNQVVQGRKVTWQY
jgi:hypothetical protein